MKIITFHKRLMFTKALFLVLFLAFTSVSSLAQVQITPATGGIFTPESLITNVFLGDGVEVTGVVFNGDPISVGYFTNGASNLEIDRGIIMTTGEAMEALGPNDATGNGSGTNSTVNDPDLNAISTAGLNDVNIYEITFIPTADTLRFRYVFASEEYPEYACTGFNDVFGFFITGPNPAGGMYNAENIARVPDPADPSGLTFTNNPVTINIVNPGVPGAAGGTVANCSPPNGSLAYAQYYNATQANSPFMQYDGYLDAFVAQAIVVPCQTYTIKLGVADAGDSAFDTAVFLEAKSFGTGSLDVEATTLSLDGTITEGCVEGTITFKLPNPAEEDYEIDYTIFGTATNGVDYQNIPTNLTILAGDTAVSIPLIAWEDGITEGIESIAFDVQRDPCNRDTFYVYIRDNEIVPPDLGPDLFICDEGAGVQLDGNLPITLPDPPTFTNSVGYDPIVTISDNNPPPTGTPPTIAPLQVFAVQPFTLAEGVIKSVCINLQHNWIDDIDIFLVSPGGQFLELTTDNGGDGNHYFQTCFTPEATVPINFPGPFAPSSAAPFTGDFQPEGLWSDLWDGDNPTNGTWQLLVKDDQTGLDGRLIDWSICFAPLYQIFYEWSPSAGLSCDDCPDPIADPDTTTTYILTAYDTYGCEVYDTITVNVIDDLPSPDLSCGIITDNSVSIDWSPIVGASSYEVNVNGSGWITASSPVSHTVSGLALNTCVDIEVRGVGDCNTLPDTITCCTPNCVPPTPSIDMITNVNCFGGNNGSVEVSAVGNYPITEYRIDMNTNVTGSFNGLTAGDYTVFITDQVNCTTQINFTISQPDTLVAIPILIDSISCNGLSDGSATVEVTGGVGPYHFDWGAQNDSIATLLPFGMANVTVTDANMCTATASIMINEPEPLSLSFDVDSLSCNASGDGSATAMPTGGVSDYTYLWDANASAQTNQTASGLDAGTYTVTVTDSKNCQISSSITIGENPPLQLATSATDASCNGVFDGTATVVVSGGAGGYSFSWNDPMSQVDSIATNLTVDSYEVTVTDAEGCSATASASVDAPNAINVDIDVTEVSCATVADGTAILDVNGGTPIYTYLWSDGGSPGPTRNDLPAGSHQVTVTDANQCFEIIDFVIDDADPIVLDLDSTIVSCPMGVDGTTSVLASGGTGTYSYLWSAAAQTTTTATGLNAGMHSVTVTDGNNCSQIASIEVTEQTPMQAMTSSIAVNCFGESNGTATVEISGGNGGYTYAWSPNTGMPVGDGSSLTNLIASNYSVTTTDIQGCTLVSTIEVTQPSELISTTSVGSASCDGAPDGTASVAPVGGVGPYQFLWSNGQTTATAINLNAIAYMVTVTDMNSCVVFDTVNIAAPPPLSLTLDSLDVSCNGANDGTVSVIANGGAGGYSYLWDDPNAQQSSTANGLSGGTYTVTVSDVNDCTIVSSIVVNEPSSIQINTDNVQNISCNGESDGLVNITVSGGEGPYSFNWNNALTTEDINGLVADAYNLTITDNIGCTATIDYTLTEPSLLSLSTDPQNINCYNGSDGTINLSVDGGTPGYTYVWSGPNSYSSSSEDLNNLEAGTYSVTVTDLNACTQEVDVNLSQPLTGVETSVSPRDTICFDSNSGQATVFVNGGTAPYNYLWDSNETVSSISNLSPGPHYVTVTDAEGCSYQDTAYVDELAIVSIELTQTSASCHDSEDGTASIVNISYGNVGGYDPSDFQISWNTFPTQNTASASSLTGGQSYTVSITDLERGCTAVQSITIDNPAEIGSTVLEVIGISCAGMQDGSATVDGQGGTTPYSFLWSNSAGAQTTAAATNLQSGIHQVRITDAEGCSKEINIEINEPEPLNNEFQKTNVDCNGSATGSILSEPRGGTAPYTYLWSNQSTDRKIEAIPAGNYQVTITDSNGCTFVTDETITQPDEILSAIINKEHVLCFEGRDGMIDIEPSGGTPPYQFSLDGLNYNGVENIVGLTAGIYTIYVRDSRGCIWSTNNIVISEPDPVLVDLGPDQIIQLGKNAQLSSLVSNAVPPLSYFWSPPDSLSCINCADPILENLQYTQSYHLQVVDANGCEGEDYIQIIVEKNRKVFVPTGFTPNADGFNDLLLVHGKEGTLIKTFQVYDRWGELVYESTNFDINDPNTGWDGTFRGQTMNTGVYVWVLDVEYVDGAEETMNGNTTLIR